MPRITSSPSSPTHLASTSLTREAASSPRPMGEFDVLRHDRNPGRQPGHTEIGKDIRDLGLDEPGWVLLPNDHREAVGDHLHTLRGLNFQNLSSQLDQNDLDALEALHKGGVLTDAQYRFALNENQKVLGSTSVGDPHPLSQGQAARSTAESVDSDQPAGGPLTLSGASSPRSQGSGANPSASRTQGFAVRNVHDYDLEAQHSNGDTPRDAAPAAEGRMSGLAANLKGALSALKSMPLEGWGLLATSASLAYPTYVRLQAYQEEINKPVHDTNRLISNLVDPTSTMLMGACMVSVMYRVKKAFKDLEQVQRDQQSN